MAGLLGDGWSTRLLFWLLVLSTLKDYHLLESYVIFDGSPCHLQVIPGRFGMFPHLLVPREICLPGHEGKLLQKLTFSWEH